MSLSLLVSAALLATTTLAAPQGPIIYTPPQQTIIYFTATVGVQYNNLATSLNLNPNNGTIWAGKPVATACPEGQPANSPPCPTVNPKGVYTLKGNTTTGAFLFLGTSEDVTQQVYVDASSGLVQFTKADEPVPDDAYTDGWTQDPTTAALSYGSFPIWACQSGGSDEGVFDIIVQFENVYVPTYFCGGTPTGIATDLTGGPGAFEYV